MAIAHFLVRATICVFGLGAVAWGDALLPLFWQQRPLDQVAAELLQGETFKSKTLLSEARQEDVVTSAASCNPTGLHNAVILRLALLDEAIAARNSSLVDSDYRLAYDAARRSLACLPADPFAWLVLFWLDVSKHGVEPDNENYLRLSYALGPNEGWITLSRTRIAVALFERLPTDLSDHAIEDFIKLVDTGRLYSETTEIFAKASPATQSRIIDHLKTANAVSRQIFARALYDKGLDVSIPDTTIPGLHSWE